MRNYFDPDQPVFQIQDPLARRWQVKPPLELSARRYVDELRRIQREGPYQLIGYSFGGVVAYEMARQLLGSGERVSFLGLLDTPAPGYVFPLPRDSRCIRQTWPSSTDPRRVAGRDLGLAEGTYIGARSRDPQAPVVQV